MQYAIQRNILHNTDCRQFKKWLDLNGNADVLYMHTIEEAIRLDPLKVCNCVIKLYNNIYKRMQLMERIKGYQFKLQKYAEMNDLKCFVNENNDLVIKSKVEAWIVAIIDVAENYQNAEICLYHKNMMHNYSNKCGTSLYPEYHVQYTKRQSIVDTVGYIIRHESGRWNIQHNSLRNKGKFGDFNGK